MMINTKDGDTKYTVFFRRANGTGDIEYQELADANYREGCLPNETLILNEIGVSANANIEQRPQMKKLVQMIKENQIKIIYVYDLARLFRDFYAFNYFDLLCRQHNVEIFNISSRNDDKKSILKIYQPVIGYILTKVYPLPSKEKQLTRHRKGKSYK